MKRVGARLGRRIAGGALLAALWLAATGLAALAAGQEIGADMFPTYKDNFSVISGLQKDLQTLGYDTGPRVGALSPQTLDAVKAFMAEYSFDPPAEFEPSLLATVHQYAALQAAHPGWREYVESGELKRWIERQPPDRIPLYKDIARVGNAKQVCALINLFVFDKERPVPIPEPATGVLAKSFKRGEAVFQVRASPDSMPYLVKLCDPATDVELLTGFVRPGETLQTRVPVGVYTLEYASGDSWYGPQLMFGPRAIYGGMGKPIDFRLATSEYSGFKIELSPHWGGGHGGTSVSLQGM